MTRELLSFSALFSALVLSFSTPTFAQDQSDAEFTAKTSTGQTIEANGGAADLNGADANGRGSWHRIGYGRLIDNDLFGDGDDRWRTGSIVSSRIYARDWEGKRPTRFGELLELRLMGQVISPENLQTQADDDRNFAGNLSAGLHTHFQKGQAEISLGASLELIGAQTRLDDVQQGVHDLVGVKGISDEVGAVQIENQIRPTFVGEVGRSYEMANFGTVRPFAELRAGDETFVRVGADLTLGTLGRTELLVRDPVTGQRYRTMYDSKGVSIVLGGDMTYIEDSVYLPLGGPRGFQSRRHRIRGGLHWGTERSAFFFGLTYLSPEFEAQDEGQVVGSLRFRWAF